MNDWWCVTMQIHQATQDLPSPAFKDFWINVLVAFAVPRAMHDISISNELQRCRAVDCQAAAAVSKKRTVAMSQR